MLSCYLSKTILQLRVTIVSSSCRDNARNRPSSRKGKTKVTRTDRMSTRWTGDGHTTDKMDTRSQHEYVPSRGPSAIFNMQNILSSLPKLLPNPAKLSRMSYLGLGCTHEWPDLFPISPDVANFLDGVSIASQNQDSVTQALWHDKKLQKVHAKVNTRVDFVCSSCPSCVNRESIIRTIIMSFSVAFVFTSCDHR